MRGSSSTAPALAIAILLALACEDAKPTAAASAQAPISPPGVRIEKAGPDQSAREQIAAARQRAESEGRKLVVYVGAGWCEPCERFKQAAKAGELDTRFPKLSLLEFDRDRDEAQLRDAGCLSRLIPLFARPTPDGRCSSQRIEGSIKGPGAVAEISPRLASLLDS